MRGIWNNYEWLGIFFWARPGFGFFCGNLIFLTLSSGFLKWQILKDYLRKSKG
jgi:hypothetical protein